MSSANRILLSLLGLLVVSVVIGYAYWFATNFEQQTREVRTNISPEARKNRFLAAEHFIRANGLEAESNAGRDIFSLEPAANDTILLGNHSSLFLQRNNEPLLAWIKSGGHLIVVPETSWSDEDEEPVDNLLQSELGVELFFVDDEELFDCEEDPDWCDESGDEEPLETDSAQSEETLPSEDQESVEVADATDDTADTTTGSEDEADKEDDFLVTVTFQTSRPGEYQARFYSNRYLYDGSDLADVAVGLPGQPNLLRYPLGEGSVTVLSDMNLFTNFTIEEYDHAYLLHQLVKGSDKVWIFYSADMPSLFALAWRRGPYLILIAAALLLLAGWRMLSKSGPQLIPQYEARRNLLEHLDATAEYSWRIDKARQLFAENRQAIEHAWRRRHPQLSTMSQEACCEWIGEQTGITAGAVHRSLYSEIATEQDFIRASAVLQRLATKVNQVTVSASSD